MLIYKNQHEIRESQIRNTNHNFEGGNIYVCYTVLDLVEAGLLEPNFQPDLVTTAGAFKSIWVCTNNSGGPTYFVDTPLHQYLSERILCLENQHQS